MLHPTPWESVSPPSPSLPVEPGAVVLFYLATHIQMFHLCARTAALGRANALRANVLSPNARAALLLTMRAFAGAAVHRKTSCALPTARIAPRLTAGVRAFASKGGDKGKGSKGSAGKGGDETADKAPVGGLLRGAGIGGNAFDEKALAKQCDAPLAKLKDEFANLRIGRIMPGILDAVHVKTADGESFALENLGDVSVKHSNTLVIALHDESHAAAVVQSIEAKLTGYTTAFNESTVTVSAPKVTKELRTGMVKQAKEKGEDAKNAIRALRADAMQALKKLGKSEDVHRIEKLIQKVIDDANKKVADAVAAKEKEIMSA